MTSISDEDSGDWLCSARYLQDTARRYGMKRIKRGSIVAFNSTLSLLPAHLTMSVVHRSPPYSYASGFKGTRQYWGTRPLSAALQCNSWPRHFALYDDGVTRVVGLPIAGLFPGGNWVQKERGRHVPRPYIDHPPSMTAFLCLMSPMRFFVKACHLEHEGERAGCGCTQSWPN